MDKKNVYLVFGSIANADESNLVILKLDRVPQINEEILFKGTSYRVNRVATEYDFKGDGLYPNEFYYVFIFESHLWIKQK